MPDPNLKAVMEEIKVILKKHDVAANIVLASPSHMEYLREVCPSWACLTVVGNGIRIKALRRDYPDNHAWQKHVTGTTNVLVMLGKKGMQIEHFTREEPKGE